MFSFLHNNTTDYACMYLKYVYSHKIWNNKVLYLEIFLLSKVAREKMQLPLKGKMEKLKLFTTFTFSATAIYLKAFFTS